MLIQYPWRISAILFLSMACAVMAKTVTPTLQQKIAAADLIVEVKVESTEKVGNDGPYVVSLANCTVSQVLKGGHIGKTLTVELRTAGDSDKISKPAPQNVKVGANHILFLKRGDEHYTPISLHHGVMVQRRMHSEYDEDKKDDDEAVRAASAFLGSIPRVGYKYSELIDRILELTGGGGHRTVAPLKAR